MRNDRCSTQSTRKCVISLRDSKLFERKDYANLYGCYMLTVANAGANIIVRMTDS